MDHRSVQRALFRMQLDPGFAARVRAREAEAVKSAGLGADEVALLAGADPIAVAADRGGKRRAQFLRNVASEFALTLAVTPDPKLAEGFTASDEFHGAVSRDQSLPLAFAEYLAARLARGEPVTRALAALERALALARRRPLAGLVLGPGEIALSPCSSLILVLSGTLDAATRVRAALDRGEPVPQRLAVSSHERERLLLRRSPEPPPFRLPEVEVESLSPALGELLTRAHRPRPRAELASDPELVEVVADLLAEGILVAG